METKTITVKELRDIVCPTCEGKGGWRECYGDYIWEGDCGLHEDFDCQRCNKTGKLEITVEHCKVCREELEWDEDNFGFDEDTETFYRCTANECDRQRKSPSKEELMEAQADVETRHGEERIAHED